MKDKNIDIKWGWVVGFIVILLCGVWTFFFFKYNLLGFSFEGIGDIILGIVASILTFMLAIILILVIIGINWAVYKSFIETCKAGRYGIKYAKENN